MHLLLSLLFTSVTGNAATVDLYQSVMGKIYVATNEVIVMAPEVIPDPVKKQIRLYWRATTYTQIYNCKKTYTNECPILEDPHYTGKSIEILQGGVIIYREQSGFGTAFLPVKSIINGFPIGLSLPITNIPAR